MKRLEEKVKDIVEVRAFSQVGDFTADPARTLSGYHFTDITSDLMGKWIERIGGLSRGAGMSVALAGFRGVGKSHFLAAVAAILTKPELRVQLSDEHVRSACEQLVRRQYPLAYVRRGSGPALIDELRSAVAASTGANANSLGTTVSEILHKASLHSGEQPFVLFFDTAAGRESRVSRDDGTILSEIAEIGRSMGMFVGVALDDDISGADGANAPIARSFVIDYLDQEHLFKIVDTHIFAKSTKKRSLLSDIYSEWRRVLPGFRWSEQRFLSLYPMHPATLEIAPLIRLYLQDFALLGFAADAGMKILGRPANSLIGLDEMFDSVEPKLRHAEELRSAFQTFDRVEQEVVSKLPVTARLPAKLILKGLFLLSIDGQGASADEIAASMMILDGGGVSADIPAVLRSFVEGGLASEADGKFKLGASVAVSPSTVSRLDEAAAEISDDVVWSQLLRHASEKFSDVDSSGEFGQLPTLCSVEWRGAVRRGEIVWRHDNYERPTESDWTIFVERRGGTRADTSQPVLLWRVATLTDAEKATLRRSYVLRTNEAVREELGDSLATQIQISSIAAERVWQRVFLQEARLVADGAEYEIFDETAGAHTLSQLLSKALTPYFDRLYPNHPSFGGSLGVREAGLLITNFFGGAAPESSETRKLVDAFAAPLGLGVTFDNSVIPTPGEQLLELPLVKAALGGEVSDHISLGEVAKRLSMSPIGLTREAQHILLAALVAQRQFDFVTASGNRINHRSLDLQIIWDDIEGIAYPRQDEYPIHRLLSWAKVVTGIDSLATIDRGDDRRQIIESLRHWHEAWHADNTIGRFDQLPEEQLNTAVWKLANGLKRTFGATAEVIERLVAEEVTLVECLKTIAEIFGDSEPDYERRTEELAVLNKYVLVSGRRGQMLSYLATADWTGDEAIDSLRRELLTLLIGGGVCLNGKNDRIDRLWSEYHKRYAAHFELKHSETAAALGDPHVTREILGSEMWSAFSSVAELPLIDPSFRVTSERLVRQLRSGGCTEEAGQYLNERPRCKCGSGLRDVERLGNSASELRRLIESALGDLRSRLSERREQIISVGSRLRPGADVEHLIGLLESGRGFPRLTSADVLLLKEITSHSTIQEDVPAKVEHFADLELLTL